MTTLKTIPLPLAGRGKGWGPLRRLQASPRAVQSAGSHPNMRSRHRLALNLLFFFCLIGAIALLGKSSWIMLKAEVAQVLLDRAFAQSISTGQAVKAWNWADTWPVAEVRVKRLGARAIVLSGASGEAMAFGPALLNETSRIGAPGTAVIAAHRDTHFRFLKDVVVGDEIAVTSNNGRTFTYRVTGMRVAAWNRSGIDAHATGFNLVLSTCYPFDAMTRGTQRYIVEAELEGNGT